MKEWWANPGKAINVSKSVFGWIPDSLFRCANLSRPRAKRYAVALRNVGLVVDVDTEAIDDDAWQVTGFGDPLQAARVLADLFRDKAAMYAARDIKRERREGSTEGEQANGND